MTWFQLVDARLSDPEPPHDVRLAPRSDGRLAPNSALFLNPALPLQSAPRPRPANARSHLRLVKGSRGSRLRRRSLGGLTPPQNPRLRR